MPTQTITPSLSTITMKLKSTEEFITFLQAVQSPTAPMSLRWHQAGAVSVALDWDTFNNLRALLGGESKYSYRDGVLTLEPPRAHFPSASSSRHAFPSTKLALKASILTQLQNQLRAYTKNGTATGLVPTVRTNIGRTLSVGKAYRTADIFIGMSAANNLDVRYDSMPNRAGALALNVVVGGADEVQDETKGVDEWFAGDKEVQQVVMMHVDAEKVAKCREKGRVASVKGAEEIGSVKRWGRDTKGKKVLLETIGITYHYAGYTDAPVMLIDLARALGVSIPHGEKLTLVLDWNHALSSINLAQNEHEKTHTTRRAVL